MAKLTNPEPLPQEATQELERIRSAHRLRAPTASQTGSGGDDSPIRRDKREGGPTRSRPAPPHREARRELGAEGDGARAPSPAGLAGPLDLRGRGDGRRIEIEVVPIPREPKKHEPRGECHRGDLTPSTASECGEARSREDSHERRP